MKTRILVALIAVTWIALLTSCKPRISGQIEADWVKPGENLRIVNGQLYDSLHSDLWNYPLEVAGFHSHGNANSRLVTYLAKVETVERDKIHCGVYEQTHWPPVANGEVESADLVQEIVIYHYPNAETLITGQTLSDCRCMRVANYISGGISLIALDCGTQSAELVPEIKGMKVDVGGVQIFLVDGKKTDDFLQKKTTESDQKCTQIEAEIEELRSELSTNELKFEEVRNVPSNFIESDSRYIAAMHKRDDAKSTIVTLGNAERYLSEKYDLRAKPHSTMTPDSINPKEYQAARQKIDAYEARIRSIGLDVERIEHELNALPGKIRAERSQQFEAASGAVEATKQKLNEANQSLELCQSPRFYWSGFPPTALETSQTDAKGKFAIHNAVAGSKIFAKAKSETGEEFFWLVDLPLKGERLILSENNLFKAPANTP